MLANIYLDRLDQFVEQTLIPEYTRGDQEKRRPEYDRLRHRNPETRSRTGHAEATPRAPPREAPDPRADDPFDPDYRRLRYIRYADDFLLGFAGPKDEAEEIKARLGRSCAITSSWNSRRRRP